MRRGISPVISIVLLVAIATVAGAGIYFWAGGLATKQPTTETPIVISATPIDEATGKIMIVNLGDESLTDTFYLAGNPNKNCTLTIAAGEQALCELDSVGGGGQGQGGFGGSYVLMGSTSVSSAVIETPVDNTAPPAISGFAAAVVNAENQCLNSGGDSTESNRSSLSWTALTSSDLTDFKEYRIYRNDTLIFTDTTLTLAAIPDDPNGDCTPWTDLDGTVETRYVRYQIRAVDNSDNAGTLATSGYITIPVDTLCSAPPGCGLETFWIQSDGSPAYL